MVATGNVVKEMSIGNTRIKICDDYCREKTKAEVEEILKRIARNAIGPLTVAAAHKAYEKNRNNKAKISNRRSVTVRLIIRTRYVSRI